MRLGEESRFSFSKTCKHILKRQDRPVVDKKLFFVFCIYLVRLSWSKRRAIPFFRKHHLRPPLPRSPPQPTANRPLPLFGFSQADTPCLTACPKTRALPHHRARCMRMLVSGTCPAVCGGVLCVCVSYTQVDVKFQTWSAPEATKTHKTIREEAPPRWDTHTQSGRSPCSHMSLPPHTPPYTHRQSGSQQQSNKHDPCLPEAVRRVRGARQGRTRSNDCLLFGTHQDKTQAYETTIIWTPSSRQPLLPQDPWRSSRQP